MKFSWLPWGYIIKLVLFLLYKTPSKDENISLFSSTLIILRALHLSNIFIHILLIVFGINTSSK